MNTAPSAAAFNVTVRPFDETALTVPRNPPGRVLEIGSTNPAPIVGVGHPDGKVTLTTPFVSDGTKPVLVPTITVEDGVEYDAAETAAPAADGVPTLTVSGPSHTPRILTNKPYVYCLPAATVLSVAVPDPTGIPTPELTELGARPPVTRRKANVKPGTDTQLSETELAVTLVACNRLNDGNEMHRTPTRVVCPA